MSRRFDVVALIFGVLLTAAAAVSLWHTFVGAINWQAVKVAAPLILVALGIVGLALSRNRD